MPKKADLTGYRYGRLTVIRMATRKVDDNGKLLPPEWECHCECGQKITIAAKNLQSGHTQSCGCLKRDNIIKAVINKKDSFAFLEEERLWGPCPYPMFGCTKNKSGWCCDDCARENCASRCLNVPEKCGCLRLKQ